MFTPLKPSVTEAIKEGGSIRLKTFAGWTSRVLAGFYTAVPHKIIYYKSHDRRKAGHWFNCLLSSMTRTIIVENIDIPSKNLFHSKSGLLENKEEISKPLVYMALGFVVDEMINYTVANEKQKLIISSGLTGIADVLVERDFEVKTRDLFARSKLENVQYRGKKEV